MRTPKANEFDGWRQAASGRWVFDFVLQGNADAAANQNGRLPGSLQNAHEDFATYIRNAGYIAGVEFTIQFDPFQEEREHETKSNGPVPDSQDGL